MDQNYPDAGENADPAIQKLIEDFRNLPPAEKEGKILLYELLGSGTPPYKMSKKDSEYTDQAEGEQNCGNCRFSYNQPARDFYICSQIRGRIKPAGWCNLWKSP